MGKSHSKDRVNHELIEIQEDYIQYIPDIFTYRKKPYYHPFCHLFPDCGINWKRIVDGIFNKTGLKNFSCKINKLNGIFMITGVTEPVFEIVDNNLIVYHTDDEGRLHGYKYHFLIISSGLVLIRYVIYVHDALVFTYDVFHRSYRYIYYTEYKNIIEYKYKLHPSKLKIVNSDIHVHPWVIADYDENERIMYLGNLMQFNIILLNNTYVANKLLLIIIDFY